MPEKKDILSTWRQLADNLPTYLHLQKQILQLQLVALWLDPKEQPVAEVFTQELDAIEGQVWSALESLFTQPSPQPESDLTQALKQLGKKLTLEGIWGEGECQIFTFFNKI